MVNPIEKSTRVLVPVVRLATTHPFEGRASPDRQARGLRARQVTQRDFPQPPAGDQPGGARVKRKFFGYRVRVGYAVAPCGCGWL